MLEIMLKSLYIITPAGTPIYYFDPIEKEDKLADAILFTGLITAIQNFLVEIEIGNPEKFATKTNEIYLETTKCFGVVLVKDMGDKLKPKNVKTFLNKLVTQLKEIIPEEESCSYVDEQLRALIRQRIDVLLPELEKTENEVTEKIKESLW